MRIQYSASARAETDEILSYISSDSPGAAKRVATAIEKTVEWVRKHPLMSPIIYGGVLRSKLVIGYQYRIFYVVERDVVAIVSVRSTRRLRPWEK